MRLKCPICGGRRVPFSESFALYGCSDCSREQKLKAWMEGLIFAVADVAANSLTVLARSRGLSIVSPIVTYISSFTVVFVLLHVWLGGYRRKPRPVSITPTE